MAIHRIAGPVRRLREAAAETERGVRIAGGGIVQELVRAHGRGRIRSAADGREWVGAEAVLIERQPAAGRRWQAREGAPRVEAVGGVARRELGEEGAVEYESPEAGPLKVRFRVRAAEAGRYRVSWKLEALAGAVRRAPGAARLAVEAGAASLVVDWSDVVASHGQEVAAAEVTPEGVTLVFGPFELGAGEEVVLDPTIEESSVYLDPYSAEEVGANARRLARTSDGTLYAVSVLSDGGTTHITVSDSADGGLSWGTMAELTTDTAVPRSGAPVIACDQDDNLHVVYRGADKHIYYRKYNGSSWSDPTDLTDGNESTDYAQDRPSIAIDMDNQIHVAWEGASSSYGASQIWYAKGSADATPSWSAPVRVYTGSGLNNYAQASPAIAVGEVEVGGGLVTYLHVVWQGFDSSHTEANQVWYLQKLESGSWPASPEPVATITDTGTRWPDRVPSLVVELGGTVHAVWHAIAGGYDTEQVWYRKRTTSWGTTERLSQGVGMTGVYPSIGIDLDGRLHVLFNGWMGTKSGVYGVEYVDGEWSMPAGEDYPEEGRRPNLRWAFRWHNEGSLDWLWLAGSTYAYEAGSSDRAVDYQGGSQGFTALESRRLGFVQLPLKRADGYNRAVTMKIYTAATNGTPDTELGECDEPQTVDNDNNYQYYVFRFTEAAIDLTAGNRYCLVIYPDAGTVNWQVDNTASYPGGVWSFFNGAAWQIDSSIDANFFVGPYFDLRFGTEAIELEEGYTYDALDNLETETDGLGQTTSYVYDAASQLTAQVNPLGYTTSFYYDEEGRQTAVEDARGNRFTYVYDAAGQLTDQGDPLGNTISYDYYDDGLLRSRLDAKNTLTTYVYDASHRRTGIEYPNSRRVTFTYDGADNVATMEGSTDSGIGITSYSHEATNLLEEVIYPGPWTVSYEYDAAGQRTTMTYVAGGTDKVTTYSYSGRGLLTALRNERGENTSWEYDEGGLPTKMTHANGTWADYHYDAAGRVAEVYHRRVTMGNTITFSSFRYDFDEAGNPIQVVEQGGDEVFWSYDAAGQLTREQRTGDYSYDVTYSYDEAGNRLTKLEGGTTATYSYDEAGQLEVKWNPSVRVTYSYDENGNTILQNNNGDLSTYQWDYENRLTIVELSGGGRTTATYYGDGKRAGYEDTVDGSPFYRGFIWDGENILFQTDEPPVMTTNRHYTYNPQGYGALISQGGLSQDGEIFHHYDGFGSTAAVTDGGSPVAVLTHYRQRAFGDDPQATSASPPPNRFRWLGQIGYYWQPDTGDYWVRARVHNPTNGRWLSRDPELYRFAPPAQTLMPPDFAFVMGAPLRCAQPPLNLLDMAPQLAYLYVRNAPLTASDPSGLLNWREFACCMVSCVTGIPRSWIRRWCSQPPADHDYNAAPWIRRGRSAATWVGRWAWYRSWYLYLRPHYGRPFFAGLTSMAESEAFRLGQVVAPWAGRISGGLAIGLVAYCALWKCRRQAR